MSICITKVNYALYWNYQQNGVCCTLTYFYPHWLASPNMHAASVTSEEMVHMLEISCWLTARPKRFTPSVDFVKQQQIKWLRHLLRMKSGYGASIVLTTFFWPVTCVSLQTDLEIKWAAGDKTPVERSYQGASSPGSWPCWNTWWW